LVFLHRTKEKAQEFIDHASTGRESGVLYHSTHNGIWCFTRGWEMDETLRIIMDIKRLKERKEREERGEL